jgi:hypothetical protein
MAREHWRTGFVLAAAASLSLLALHLAFSGTSAHGRAAPFAKLVFEASSDDRAIVAALTAAGFRDIVSESTQWVLVDDFGDGERVPLDRYRERVETFDPRDDGYADKLRTVFLSGGKRYVYVRRPIVPLLSGSAASFDRKLRGALEGLAFSIESDAAPPRAALPRALVALACLALSSFLSKSAVKGVFAFPAILSLSVWGPAGFAAAGFLYAAYLSSFSAFRELSRAAAAFVSKKGKDRATLDGVSFKRGWGFESFPAATVLSSSSLVVSVLGGIPAALFAAAAGSAVLCAASQLRASELLDRRRGHARFAPLSLRPAPRSSIVRGFGGVLPFSLAAVGLLIVGLAAGSASSFESAGADQGRVALSDYRAHLERQNSFRTTNLHSARSAEEYPAYRLDSSGLAVPHASAPAGNVLKVELPPAERYLIDPVPGSDSGARSSAGLVPDLIAIVCSLIVSLPAFLAAGLVGKKAKEIAESAEKRIAA